MAGATDVPTGFRPCCSMSVWARCLRGLRCGSWCSFRGGVGDASSYARCWACQTISCVASFDGRNAIPASALRGSNWISVVRSDLQRPVAISGEPPARGGASGMTDGSSMVRRTMNPCWHVAPRQDWRAPTGDRLRHNSTPLHAQCVCGPRRRERRWCQSVPRRLQRAQTRSRPTTTTLSADDRLLAFFTSLRRDGGCPGVRSHTIAR